MALKYIEEEYKGADKWEENINSIFFIFQTII